jgi:hypothetical protein
VDECGFKGFHSGHRCVIVCCGSCGEEQASAGSKGVLLEVSQQAQQFKQQPGWHSSCQVAVQAWAATSGGSSSSVCSQAGSREASAVLGGLCTKGGADMCSCAQSAAAICSHDCTHSVSRCPCSMRIGHQLQCA